MPKNPVFLSRSLVVIAIIIVSLVSLAAVWFLGKSTQKDIEEALVEQYSEQNLVVAREIATIFEAEIANVQESLQLIARIPEVRDGNSQVCSKKLKEISEKTLVKLGNLGRMGKDGVFYCGAVDSIIGVDGKQYDYLKQILNDPEHRPVLSRAVMFKYTDSERFLVALHVPVFDEGGNFTGTLGGAIYFDELQEKYLAIINFAEGSYATICDDDGTILSHPNADFISRNSNDDYMKKILAESEGLPELTASAQKGETDSKKYFQDGEWQLASYTPANIFDGRYWPVLVTIPFSQIEGFVNPLITELQYQIIVSISILVAFALGIIVLLLRWNKALAKEVRQRTKEVSELNEVLRLLNKILRHDLLNDLTVVQGSVDTYFEYKEKTDLKELFESISKAMARSIGFISKMKGLETAVSSGEELKPVDVVKVVAEAQQKFPEMKISIEGKGTVLADEALTSVIENIIRNAKMHGKTEKVDVRIEEKDGIVEIAIADYGQGIPDKVKPKLFTEMFKYGETGKTGLGLYIVRKTIERYGGSVSIEDNKPKGAVFRLRVPRIRKQQV